MGWGTLEDECFKAAPTAAGRSLWCWARADTWHRNLSAPTKYRQPEIKSTEGWGEGQEAVIGREWSPRRRENQGGGRGVEETQFCSVFNTFPLNSLTLWSNRHNQSCGFNPSTPTPHSLITRQSPIWCFLSSNSTNRGVLLITEHKYQANIERQDVCADFFFFFSTQKCFDCKKRPPLQSPIRRHSCECLLLSPSAEKSGAPASNLERRRIMKCKDFDVGSYILWFQCFGSELLIFGRNFRLKCTLLAGRPLLATSLVL